MRTGLFFEHHGIADPMYDGLRMTIPVRESLEANGHVVTPNGDLFTVILSGRRMSRDVVACCIVGKEYLALRLDNEPEYPGECPAAWYQRGEWLPCPQCGAPIVWYEAGYVPGYRVCVRKPHHHCQLSNDGRKVKLV